MRFIVLLTFVALFSTCYPPDRYATEEPFSLIQELGKLKGIEGNDDYLSSPYVTAGDRVYQVGYQDGSFPDLGWHVPGEMGGIWDHPIKLMDGFTASIQEDETTYCLDNAQTFVNYPIGNIHRYGEKAGLRIERAQFVPDGEEAIVIQFAIQNQQDEARQLTFGFTGMADLRPVWLGDSTNMIDSTDQVTFLEEKGCLVAKDDRHDWYVVWGNLDTPSGHAIGETACDFARAGLGANGSLYYDLSLPAQGDTLVEIVIAGSYQSQSAAQETWEAVQRSLPDLYQAKRERYVEMVNTARIKVPDSTLQTALEWTRYNTDWLVRTVPEFGTAISAGIPDYPWWFGCDATYALQGVLASGRQDIVYSTLELIKMLSEERNGNGRVIHEASTNGAVFNPGNINETPHFASMVWTVYEWTGDRAFLREFYPFVQKGLNWLLAENDADGNYCPDGAGMMEIHGLDSEMIDVAVYTQQAFADAARMAEALQQPVQAEEYQAIADQLRERINTEFWVPEFNSYADFISTPAEALHLIDDAIIRADTLGKPWAVKELEATKAAIANFPAGEKRGFVLHHNWVVNTPLEMGIADSAKAQLALATGRQFVNPFGVFVTGIDRDESAGTDDSSFAEDMEIFSYVGAVMTLPTGVQAIAENNYGNPDQALDYLQRLTNSFSYALPGSMYEVSPDFGMITQAWTIYSLTYPVVQQFFGVQPQAYEQAVILRPQMPSSWNEASLTDLPIGTNTISIEYQRTEAGEELHIQQLESDWSFTIQLPLSDGRIWMVNGEAATPVENGGYQELVVDGEEVVVTWSYDSES